MMRRFVLDQNDDNDWNMKTLLDVLSTNQLDPLEMNK